MVDGPDRRCQAGENETSMKVLMLSHGHPAFSIGGAEVASYNLFNGLNRLPGLREPLSRPRRPADQPPPRHAVHEPAPEGARDALLRERLRPFPLSNRDVDALAQRLRALRRSTSRRTSSTSTTSSGFGIEALRAVRRALPNARDRHDAARVPVDLPQSRPDGEGNSRQPLCQRASPAECAVLLSRASRRRSSAARAVHQGASTRSTCSSRPASS